jgi:hypothetical protein
MEGDGILEGAAQIWLSFTPNIEDATSATPPTPLLPGANLLSVVDYTIRQRLKPGSLATLGFDVGV